MAVHIQNLTGLKILSATLHDASFTESDASFDPASNAFSLKCWAYASQKFAGSVEAGFEKDRIAQADKASVRAPSFWSYLWRRPVTKTGNEHCWKECFVTFKSVTRADIVVKEKVRSYELSTLRLSKDESCLELVCHYGIEINLFIERLDIILTEGQKIRDSLN